MIRGRVPTDDMDRVLADIDSLLPPGAPSTPDSSGERWVVDAMRWQPVDHDHHPEVRPSSALASADDWARSASDGHAAFSYAMSGWVAPSQAVYDLATRLEPYPAGVPDRYGVVTEAGWAGIEYFHPQVHATPPRYSGVVERRWMHGEGDATWPAVWAGPSQATLYRRAVEAEYAAAIDNLTREAQRTATNLQHLRDRWDRHGQAQAVIEARRNRNTGPTNPRGADGRARRHQHPRKAAARHASPATQGNATPATRAWLDLIGGAGAMACHRYRPSW